MTNYPVGDFLIQIKNAGLAKRRYVSVSKTKLILSVAKVLAKEGYLGDVVEEKNLLKVQLKFYKKEPVLLDLKLVSRPGLRVYKSAEELKRQKGASFLIVSTPQGVVSSRQAIKQNIGGEAIAEIW
jgi:small subunit ribosomal protein S8